LFSLCGTTSGRIILSQLQKENQILHLMETEEFSSLSKKQQSQYLSEVETVGNNGHDIRKSETTQGVFDIAIPFSIPEININGSVTVSALTGQSQKNISNDFILNKLNSTVLNVYKNLGILPK
jgi:DNA-binding IclR family transcriptional regulator